MGPASGTSSRSPERQSRRFSIAATFVRAALAAAVWAPSDAAAHPGHGQPTVVIAQFAFKPSTLNAFTFDSVVWFWNGPDTKHSVTADPGQAESFDSDPGKGPAEVQHSTGDVFAYYFSKPGTYTYRSKSDPFMTGTIVITDAPPGPGIPPPPVIAAAAVRLKQSCKRVRHHRHPRCQTTGGEVRFANATNSIVSGDLTRVGSTASLQHFNAPSFAGIDTFPVNTDNLQPGTYAVTLVANDSYGRTSAPAQAIFQIASKPARHRHRRHARKGHFR